LLPFRERPEDVVSSVAVSGAELIEMPLEPAGTRRLLHLVDAAEQEIRGHLKARP
jgi:hypothetical protein